MKPTRYARYARHRFPAEVISYAIWLYFRFPLSLRMVEDMLTARVKVSHETVRQWALKFGRASPTKFPGVFRYPETDGTLIRSRSASRATSTGSGAVDQNGVVLNVLVQSRRDAKAAKRLRRKLLMRQCRSPRVMITDKLSRSHARNHACCRTPSAQEAQQSGGEFSPPNAPARAYHDTLQVCRAGAVLPFGS